MKNILIYSVNPQSPHLATDLELASKFKDRGDQVTIVRCTGQLKSCLVNPKHNLLICASCKSKYQKALRLSGLDGVNVKIISLPLYGNVYDDIPESFKNIDELRAFRFQGADLGFSVLSTLVGRFYDHKFDTLRYKKEVFNELKMCVDVYKGLKQILEEIKPDEVYFFNGRFSSIHPLKNLCIERNITYFTHEIAGLLNKYTLRKNAMPHNIDYSARELQDLWGMNLTDRVEVGAKFFTNRRNKVVDSMLSFTESQAKGLLPEGLDRRKKNIVIFNTTMEEYEGMEDWKNPIYKDDNEGIRQILESFKTEKDYMFYLRVHPNMRLLNNTQTKEIGEIAAHYKNLYLIRPEHPVDTYALMDAAYKVVTFGSTAGVEATFWSKVSILFGKSLYMNIDACYQPTTHQAGVELILNENICPKDRINAIKYGYWERMKGEYFEKFKQLDLYTMSVNGEVIEAPLLLRVQEKFAKLALIRNKRGLDNLKAKIRNAFRWK